MANNLLTRINFKQPTLKNSYVNCSRINNSNFPPGNYGLNVLYNSRQEINRKSNGTKLVLLWSPLFKGWNLLETERNSFANGGCLETRCKVTSDRRRLLESDAVVFHLRTMSLTDIPRFRKRKQKWIAFNMEAPPHSRYQGLAYMSGMFNWTMTYRDDSDVVVHYGSAIHTGKRNFDERQLYLEWKKKSKMAVWMVSNCASHSRREKYVQEMKKYIDVNTFGLCGMATCPENKTDQCLENFSRSFLFYLSFENSICAGYITEKFYRSLKHNMIPVVFGGGNYSAIAPPGSYINAFDFDSPKILSSHLNKVASNFTLYSAYFKWKFEGYDIQTMPSDCGLCDKLHSDSFHDTTVYSDLDDWWVKKSHCRKWG